MNGENVKLNLENEENIKSWELEIIQKNKNDYFLVQDIQDELNSIKNSLSKNIEYKLLPEESVNSSILQAFNLISIKNTKVLILGQDPYPDGNEKNECGYRAHGLAFSFGNNAKEKDSLKNIFEKLKEAYKKDFEPQTRNLKSWAEQGILLLNICLTYGKIRPLNKNLQKQIQDKHIKLWKPYTEKIIEKLINYKIKYNKPIVIMLWGKEANKLSIFKDKNAYKEYKNILILRSSHPSNQGKNYCGKYEGLNYLIHSFVCPCHNHFVECNTFLEKNKEKPINWNLEQP